MASKEYAGGDLVRLKSGGPVMTVERGRTRSGLVASSDHEIIYTCVWFEQISGQYVRREGVFAQPVLEAVD